MQNKWRPWIGLAIIVILSWLELQFFTETDAVGETERQIAHISFLMLIATAGYIALYRHPAKWLKSLWLMTYLLILLVIIGVGVANRQLAMGVDFLDEIHQMRVFFSTPIPFLILMAIPYKRLPKE